MSNSYSKDFQENAVNVALEGNKSYSSISKELGISSNTLTNWVKQHKANLNPDKLSELNELIESRKEIAKLRTQVEILKKAMAICNPN